MYKYYSKWRNRRIADGLFMPILFLVLEIIFYISIVYLVNQFHIFLLTLLSTLIVMYFFITSSLVRLRAVYYRQKFQNEDNTYKHI